jgi:two-component system, sensor histidine kinase YesM
MSSLRDIATFFGDHTRNLRLFPKYLLSHGIVTVFTAIVVSIVSFNFAKDEIEVYARASAYTIMEQTGLLLEKNGSELQKNLVAQLEQADIYRTLRESGASLDSASTLNLEHKIAAMMSTNRWMRSVYFESPRGQRAFVAAEGAKADPQAIRSFVPSTIHDLHGRAYWYVDGAGSAYFCKQLYDLETTADLGVLAIGTDSSFFDMLSSSIGKSRGLGAFFVLSKDSNQLIFHTAAPPAALERVSSWAGRRETPPREFRDKRDSYLVSALVTDSQNWEIINIITMGELTALSARTGILILETSLCILAVALILAFFLVRSEVGKITTLVEQTRLISEGKFDLEVGFRSGDELGELASEISSMASEIGDLVNKVAAERNQKTEAELRALKFEYSALQSKINPHFVSNTLELINSMAKLKGLPEISEIACLLGDLMRESIRRKEDLLPLAEELEHCRIYLHIQELLLESRLNVEYEIDESLLRCRVPNLILQPIIENAVIHGIEPKLGSSRLVIAARRDGADLELVVSDDGVGIEAERLPSLLAPRSPDEAGTKIGLESVDKRVKILFGPAYGVAIESGPGEGTRVRISMPAIAGAA